MRWCWDTGGETSSRRPHRRQVVRGVAQAAEGLREALAKCTRLAGNAGDPFTPARASFLVELLQPSLKQLVREAMG